VERPVVCPISLEMGVSLGLSSMKTDGHTSIQAWEGQGWANKGKGGDDIFHDYGYSLVMKTAYSNKGNRANTDKETLGDKFVIIYKFPSVDYCNPRHSANRQMLICKPPTSLTPECRIRMNGRQYPAHLGELHLTMEPQYYA
jgi:hypothetical protein